MLCRRACRVNLLRLPLTRLVILLAVALAMSGATAGAQKLDKAAEEWLKSFRLLALPDEVKTLRQLKPADLEEFTRIFWARRSPDPFGPDNPFKASIDRGRAAADARFGDVGKKGSQSACGQVFMLLGNPDEVTGRELQNTFDTRPTRDSQYRRPDTTSRNATRDGARRPETWTYKSSATRTFRMPGGDLKLQFDDGCEFDEGARALDELARVAAERVVHPEIRYEFGPDGRLRRPATPSPAISPARRLLDQPRSDFSAVFEMKLQVPGQGGTYTAGIIRGGAGALSPVSGQLVRLRALARATPETGSAVEVAEREIYASVLPDGSFVTSYGFMLPPARYAVSIGLFDPASEKGTVTTVNIDCPDFGAKTLVVGPLVVSSDASAPVAVPGADPYAAFAIGAERLVARPENALAQSDSLMLLVLVHNAALDSNTNRASLRAAFSVLQDGKVVATSKEQVFDTAAAAASVGPVALTQFQPGPYVARVEVADDVAKVVVVRESAFEVRR